MKIKRIICIGILCFLLSAFTALGAAPVLKVGMTGDDVVTLQTNLARYGYYRSGIDGQFGSGTMRAVLDFQADCGIYPDGVVGEQTWEALKNFTSNAVSRGRGGSRSGDAVVALAQRYLGTSYVWGGSSPGGFDCSGFILYVFQQCGVNLPRMADGQFEYGMKVANSDLRPGDAVFFTTYEPGASHVGIYIGNGLFIHASSAAGQVTITSLSKQYYRDRYLGARRYLN